MSTESRRSPLTPDRIVRTALSLIDSEGLDRLSIRRLGDALGVEGMAIYRHVAGKDAVLDGVRRLLVEEFGERVQAAGPFSDWYDHLKSFGTCYREVTTAHPNAVPLLATHATVAWSHGREVAGAALSRLVDAGFQEDVAIAAERTVIRYVLGFSLIEAANRRDDADDGASTGSVDTDQPEVGRLLRSITANEDQLFDVGLELILDGLAARRDRVGQSDH